MTEARKHQQDHRGRSTNVSSHTTLLKLAQEQQKRIENLLVQSKTLMRSMAKEKSMLGPSDSTMQQTRETWNQWHKHCKVMMKQSSINCFSLEANKDKRPQWYLNKMENKGKQNGQSKE